MNPKKITAYQIVNPKGAVCTIKMRLIDGTNDKATYNSSQMSHFAAACVMLQNRNVYYLADHKAFISQENSNEFTFDFEL